jgi:uncharacterized membrane protein
MSASRLEAFSDGVIAVIITIMVLELRPPEGTTLAAFTPLIPVFLGYVMSFIVLGIYWNNHHHLLRATKSINGSIMWANLHLLFWLSLIPFATAWVGEHPLATWPAAAYGFALFMPGFAFRLLVTAIIAHHGRQSAIAAAIGGDFKGIASLVLYLSGIAVAFYSPWISYALYTGVAIVWFIPDRRVEKIGRSE